MTQITQEVLKQSITIERTTQTMGDRIRYRLNLPEENKPSGFRFTRLFVYVDEEEITSISGESWSMYIPVWPKYNGKKPKFKLKYSSNEGDFEVESQIDTPIIWDSIIPEKYYNFDISVSDVDVISATSTEIQLRSNELNLGDPNIKFDTKISIGDKIYPAVFDRFKTTIEHDTLADNGKKVEVKSFILKIEGIDDIECKPEKLNDLSNYSEIQKPAIASKFDTYKLNTDFIPSKIYKTKDGNLYYPGSQIAIDIGKELNIEGSVKIVAYTDNEEYTIYEGYIDSYYVSALNFEPTYDNNHIRTRLDRLSNNEPGKYKIKLVGEFQVGNAWELKPEITEIELGEIELIEIEEALPIFGSQIRIDRVPTYDLDTGKYEFNFKTTIPEIENAKTKSLFIETSNIYLFGGRYQAFTDITGFKLSSNSIVGSNGSMWEDPYSDTGAIDIYSLNEILVYADDKVYYTDRADSSYIKEFIGIYQKPSKNTLSIKSDGFGKPIQFTGDIELKTFKPTTKVLYSLIKDNKVIQGPSSYKEFVIESASSADNGEYQIRTEVSGRSALTETSIFNSNKVKVEIPAQVKVTAKAEAPVAELGAESKLTGIITISPDTMTDVKWVKDDIELESLGKTLTPELDIAEVQISDLGSYVIRVFYKEGNDNVTFDSEPVILTLSTDKTIDATVSVETPAQINEGDNITLKGKVEVKGDVPGIAQVVQWHHGNTAIVGANKLTYTINKADYVKDSGEYWMSVRLSAEGYTTLIKRSEKVNLSILRDPKLKVIAKQNKTEVTSGAKVELRFDLESAFEIEYSSVWYADDIEIPESKDIELYNPVVDKTTQYYVMITPISKSKVISTPVKSNVLTVEVVDDDLELISCSIDGPSKAQEYEAVFLTAIVNPPEKTSVKYKWSKDGNIVSTSDKYSFIMNKSKAGTYSLKVIDNLNDDLFVETTHEIALDDSKPGPDPDPELDGTKYIHDLNPARNNGYYWLGWWVHDEINDALVEGFDWMADPENERFKYKVDLKTLAYGFKTWDDLEVQESRHGYILTKRDLTE